jgi:hypothetical protein
VVLFITHTPSAVLQVLAAPWLVGWLMGDWVHIVVPGMRALLLAVSCGLLPLPLLKHTPATGSHNRHASPDTAGGSFQRSQTNTTTTPNSSSSSSSAAQLQTQAVEARSMPRWRLVWVSPRGLAQQPGLRTSLLVVQRLMRPLAAAASAMGATVPPRLLHLSILGYWDSPSQYALLGWTASLMTVSEQGRMRHVQLGSSLLDKLAVVACMSRAECTRG